jgi:hypothetical protein
MCLSSETNEGFMPFTVSKFQDISLGPDSRRSPFISEFVQILATTPGAAVNETATYKPQFGKPIQIVGGAFRISAIAGDNTATIQAKVALATGEDAIVEILCKL